MSEPPTRNIRLLVQYDGTGFSGWQMQLGDRTVQGDVTAALEAMVHHPVKLGASSRTDAGVHAAGMPANFQTTRDIPLHGFVMGLNGSLPDDVAVLEAVEVAPTWDARDAACAKTYCYRFLIGETRRPLWDRRSWWVRRLNLDVEAMHAAAQAFLGSHDYNAFRAAKCNARTSRRCMYAVDVAREAGGMHVTMRVTGNAFVRHMVRIMAGTLFRVGTGQTRVEEVAEILASCDRTRAGMTAPARGLTLEKVHFDGYPRLGKS
ncbi:MAG: tRNA pseudouridine(38-40) synthase TruA [Myxococcota bacterium]|nr:tRNA pseudouridine(38-40) synthase TruA [Myxococcota bacterium]